MQEKDKHIKIITNLSIFTISMVLVWISLIIEAEAAAYEVPVDQLDNPVEETAANPEEADNTESAAAEDGWEITEGEGAADGTDETDAADGADQSKEAENVEESKNEVETLVEAPGYGEVQTGNIEDNLFLFAGILLVSIGRMIDKCFGERRKLKRWEINTEEKEVLIK